MNTSLKTIAAVTGALISLTACGGGDDDGAADPAPTTADTEVTSPGDGTADPPPTTTDTEVTSAGEGTAPPTRPKNPPPTPTTQPGDPPPTTTATAGEGSCSQEISADVGAKVKVIDDLCVDGWAYIDACPGCGGDTQQVARRVDGSWSVVLAFPISPDQPRCRADWEAQGMPAAILDRINWPCTAPSPPATTGQGSPATTDAAAARLQQWIRAYGRGDMATYCDIAGPWFEANGLPRAECPDFFAEFRTDPAEDLASIAEATVDASQATEVAPGTVEIPATAISFPTPISDPPDGPAVMKHDGTDWYLFEPPD